MLAPSYQLTKDWSTDSASLSLILSGVEAMKRYVSQQTDDSGIISLKKTFVEKLESKFSSYYQESIVLAAILLDPQY